MGKGPLLEQKSLKLKMKLLVLSHEKTIKVSMCPFVKISNQKTKLMKAMQGTTCALIKQLLIESTTMTYKKQLILLRLGFSHLFYFKIPSNLKIFYKKRVQ